MLFWDTLLRERVHARVVPPEQDDLRARLPRALGELPQIDPVPDVAVGDEQFVALRLARHPGERPGGAQDLGLEEDLLDAPVARREFRNPLREMVRVREDAHAGRGDPVDHAREQRLVDDRDQGLRDPVGQRPQPSPQAGAEDQRVHSGRSSIRARRIAELPSRRSIAGYLKLYS